MKLAYGIVIDMKFNEAKIFEQGNNPYENPENTVLYRYENPAHPYLEKREGIVSKKELIGSWYCDDLKDLKGYTLARKPGGRFVVVSIPTSDLGKYDAQKLESTKEMDIEPGNYVIGSEVVENSRVEIPLEIDIDNRKRFNHFKDGQAIFTYIQERLSKENLSTIYSEVHE